MQKKINSGLFLQIAEVTHINCKKQKTKKGNKDYVRI